MLSEWGRFEEAVLELTEAMQRAASFVAEAYARNSRAHALAGMGEINRALDEFALAEAATPGNAWLHYFRARCYDDMGEFARAADCYVQSLNAKSPALNGPKRLDATRRLLELA